MTRRNWTRRTSYSRARYCATHTLDLHTRSRKRRCRSKPKFGRTCNARFLRKRSFVKEARALDRSLTCNRELCLSHVASSISRAGTQPWQVANPTQLSRFAPIRRGRARCTPVISVALVACSLWGIRSQVVVQNAGSRLTRPTREACATFATDGIESSS